MSKKRAKRQQTIDEADAKPCSDQKDCGSCVDTTLSDGMTMYQWFKDGEYCASGCDKTGCGEKACIVDDSCFVSTCTECLESQKRVWVPVEGCMRSCDMIADAVCFPSDKYSASDVCDISGGDMTEGVNTDASPPPTSGACGETGSTISIIVAAFMVIASGALQHTATFYVMI